METKGSGGGSSRKPPSASRASCNTIAKERDDRIERSEGLLCGHLHPAPSENFSLPASSQLIQSGCCFCEQPPDNVECQIPLAFSAATKEWGTDQMLNNTYAFHASSLYNGIYPNITPNQNSWTDHMRNPCSTLIESCSSINSNNLYMQSDVRSVLRVPPTFPPLCPASEKGMLMNFFQYEPSYAKQNKNSEESLRSMSCRVVQSKACEEPRTHQIYGLPISHNSMGKRDDLKFGGSELRLLVRKELTKSDVGTVGRIVLPKKEAEANLPPLIERDGIMLLMNDLILPVAWKFKYRFWPNNRSRMYILEATGDFVKAHCLQSGDVFIIYRSSASGNYIVTGEKRARECSASANTFNCSCKKECSKIGDCESPASTTT
ncbi:putative B3 domain-containing protein Os04g0676650 [Ananas comosus]|uniref:B3 domain-containing protein Os04g0676650 n=1 Tax=Ananas comosus TaxID=4615 RepID=A0A6P5EAB7_ANACO|nr:putative B3 domain-containing protein Os04g0676650 [Ananas comosus]